VIHLAWIQSKLPMLLPHAFVFGITKLVFKQIYTVTRVFHCGLSTLVTPVSHEQPSAKKLAGPETVIFIEKLEKRWLRYRVGQRHEFDLVFVFRIKSELHLGKPLVSYTPESVTITLAEEIVETMNAIVCREKPVANVGIR